MEREWPLDVYRYGAARGWEKQLPAHMAGDQQHHLKPNATGIPRAGCIVIMRFRLKIALTTGNGSSNESAHQEVVDSSQDSSRAPKAAEEGAREVVRRNDCLLFSSKNSVRTILLKFASARECIEFSDQLLRLNRSLIQVPPVPAPAPLPAGAVTPGAAQKSMRELIQEEELPVERGVTNADPTSVEIQGNAIHSYVARLLHDKSFISFTHKIEELMEASPDIAQILQAAVTSSRDDKTSDA